MTPFWVANILASQAIRYWLIAKAQAAMRPCTRTERGHCIVSRVGGSGFLAVGMALAHFNLSEGAGDVPTRLEDSEFHDKLLVTIVGLNGLHVSVMD